MHRSRFTGLYGKCIFNFIRYFLTIFQNGCTILHFYQHCGSSSCSASLSTFGIISLFYFSYSGRCVWNFITLFICILNIVSFTCCYFKYLLEWSVKSFAHFYGAIFLSQGVWVYHMFWRWVVCQVFALQICVPRLHPVSGFS